jgi:hypothetical protein
LTTYIQRVLTIAASRPPKADQWRRRRHRFDAQRAFTLLELILALSLSVLIMMAIGMAVQVHLRFYDSRQNVLQESQMARAILRIVARDIRGVVMHYEQDVSGIETMLSSVSSAAVGGGDGSEPGAGGGGEGGGAAGGGETGGGTSAGGGTTSGSELIEGSSEPVDLSTTATLPTTPGIYGNQYQLQIDISRLPRLDEYQQAFEANPNAELVDIPSDVKTVSYFMTQTDSSSATTLDPLVEPDGTTIQGLVRRQLDRAITQYAMTNASATSLMQSGDLLATEVARIEFQYFDGIEWRTEWDTEYEEGLPLAIQVLLYVGSGTDVQSLDDDSDSASTRYYRLVVDLPTGKAATTETTSEEPAL